MHVKITEFYFKMTDVVTPTYFCHPSQFLHLFPAGYKIHFQDFIKFCTNRQKFI